MTAGFGDVLVETLAGDDARLLIVAGALTAGPAKRAFDEYPDRVVSVGRGEQNAILVAVGLAAEGRTPLVLLHGPQMTGRSAAIFNALAETDAPNVLVIVSGSLPAGAVAPRAANTAAATDAASAAAQLANLAAAAGPRVLFVPAADD